MNSRVYGKNEEKNFYHKWDLRKKSQNTQVDFNWLSNLI